MPTHNTRLERLINSHQQHLIANGLKGVEKECLRITPDGKISQSPHPRALGSALTHPYITTDYSEALLEFITPPFQDTRETLSFLRDIHQFVYDNLAEELLLASSMPCAIDGDESIPIATYGTSNIGMMKHIYRRGLDYRYGRSMQAIAGVHFNYSVPEVFWPVFQDLERNRAAPRDFIADAYFSMIRNLQRWGWIALYLFGASPAICKSFVRDRKAFYRDFDEFDPHTFFKPYATSLRMSDIGYKNNTQSQLHISYNNLQDYIESLTLAIETPFPDYRKIGIRVAGEYRQLNDNILQIENEYYSSARPKQIADSGEKPTLALKRRGVRYVEVRSLDIELSSDIGVTEERLFFMEALLLTCLLLESPQLDRKSTAVNNQNFLAVAYAGRDPALILKKENHSVKLRDWALEICESMRGICEILDATQEDRRYTKALENQIRAVRDPERTPSARILAEMRETRESFADYALHRSEQYRRSFKSQTLSSEKTLHFEEISRESLAEQQQMEREQTQPFDVFLDRYFSQR
ncbi:MAG: glutamate--cysteine ligase [Methylococcaceae bacterium]|nr:glutamate--cysteine ligase [Methylococcaceae bacterium]